ncbi:MAG TPA: NAD(P)/FAD-dependent oxidoreductase [Xanthomonadales bacterium]|nr:NAD(P)/FAD-dependent oxidoreductase [Xanthomonadales bacterium]
MTEANKKVVIIGAGHNGLVCAAYLAKAGFEVNVLEASTRLGGAAITDEFEEGFRVSSAAHLLYGLDESIISDLELEKHGLEMAHEGLDTIALSPEGDHLQISGDQIKGENISGQDQEAMVEYHRKMIRFAGIFGSLHDQVPPRLASDDRSQNMALARLAFKIRRLGKKDMREFLRIAGINLYDLLEETFDNELLKGALSLDGVLGAHLGPRSNNSVFSALHRMSGSVAGKPGAMALPRGGMGAVSDALAEAAKSHGASILLDARVARIETENGRAVGASLPSGETMPGDYIISNCDPKTTFLKLLGARHLDAGIVGRVSNIRQSGSAAKLHLALDGLPEFTGLDAEHLGHRLVIAPDMDYVERAFNHAKYGEHSTRPIMEITIPGINDPGLAPDGKHVLSAIVQYAPYGLKQGWDNAKTAFRKIVLDTLEQYAPSIRKQIIADELLTPRDMEERFGNSGGHWHHAELTLDQFLMLRPVAGAAQYATPVDGLYHCGAGAHPGGGVMGHAGRNAARVIAGENN